MQYKHFLFVFLFAIAVSPLYAQQKAVYPKDAAAAKYDTTITRTGKQGQKPENTLLASNLPASSPNANKDKKGYNHIPLAGEKAYFGEKNDYVNDYVLKYLELHNKTLGNVQNKSATPFSVIDNVLEEKNLPKELKYIAVIESALDHNAVSRAGAVGTWQLMSSTARMLGLSVSRHNDDRRDLYKSTGAATHYLEILYSELNDWLLVISAYNCGPIPVERAIEHTGSRSFWDIKPYLPRETQGYVLAFIATASIFENLNKFISLGSVPIDFKFGTEEETPLVTAKPAAVAAPTAVTGKSGAATTTAIKQPPTSTFVKKAPIYTDEELKNMSIVRITEPINFEILMLETGIDKKLLAQWNPDYDMFIYNKYPTPFYNLRIPKDKLDVFLQKKEEVLKKSKVYYAANK